MAAGRAGGRPVHGQRRHRDRQRGHAVHPPGPARLRRRSSIRRGRVRPRVRVADHLRRRARPHRRLPSGVGLLTAAMALLVTPLAFGREQGWPAWTWTCLGASVVAFAGFTGFERRRAARGGDPAINLRLLARPTVPWELTANFARTST